MRLVAVAMLALLAGCVTPAVAPRDVVNELAPTGKLRAAINFGNAVLAQREPFGGVSVDLARELGKRLRVQVEFATYDAAGRVTADATKGVWDVAFVARDPERAKDIEFTPAYVIIEGGYMVPASSPIQSVAEVDRPGMRIAVGRGSAYDLWLTRNLKQATIVRAPTSPAAIELFRKDNLEVAANVKQPLMEYARRNPDVRVLPGRFMAIEQAMATPRGRSAGARYLTEFINEMKGSGFVAAALERSGQRDATVAP
ncbi:MAG TPA: ABC transporter substrate-binding protein [Burkholderiales bacterium]|nr:ABC transporter substrate-binding protein [Burkholderiales bacterium]